MTILQNRLEELLVFEISLAGQREYRSMVSFKCGEDDSVSENLVTWYPDTQHEELHVSLSPIVVLSLLTSF